MDFWVLLAVGSWIWFGLLFRGFGFLGIDFCLLFQGFWFRVVWAFMFFGFV